MTCTSEISGSASRGMCRIAQIPAKSSSNVPVKTKKRFRAHQSTRRLTISHTSRDVHGPLLARNHCPVFLREDRHLPHTPRWQFSLSFINSSASVGKRYGDTLRGHAHRRNRRHEKRYFHAGARYAGTVRIGELYAKNVAAFQRRRRNRRK